MYTTLHESQIVSETKKITRLHFYLHGILGGDSPTDWTVAQCNLTDVLPSSFGKVMVLDNLVTSGPELVSEEVGRVQGGTVGMADPLRDNSRHAPQPCVHQGGVRGQHT
ncbi:hypothetical protein SASPL_135863 [Salvia splendens]|uniref:Dirigent protein n=1 Tax=Salvia splendens TaxID=180675 RepID=A0A8X8WX75_SALSN|nr:hypothetical protein SASPL_135863 [Salvia splendens]